MAENKKPLSKVKSAAKKAAEKQVKNTERKTATVGIRNKDDAQRVLRHVPEEKRFYCHDGRILNNIYELKIALEDMHSDTYNHHVNEEKNDFARWVREVLIDDKLAHDLMKCADSKAAAQIVAARISWLQARV